MKGGALAVEFFFLISGYFLARSIEKVSSKKKLNVFKETMVFMWGKIKGLLAVHIVAIIAIVIVIVCTISDNVGKMIVDGLPSVFLVHMFVVWNSSFNRALIVPEWYLSAMLITMLFMFPIGLLFRKLMRGALVTVVLLGFILAALVICGFSTSWSLPQNFVYDLRAWAEMCVGMFAYYLSMVIAKKQPGDKARVALQVVEIVLYIIPIVFGFVPFPAAYSYVTMIITVICVFGAIIITFAKKGYQVRNEKANTFFGWLGIISLAIYLFHPVFISLFQYAKVSVPLYAYYLIIFSLALVSAIIFELASTGVKKLIGKCGGCKKKEAEKSQDVPLESVEQA